ncbi:patatin-like phospholipase family protein [Psychrobacter sp. FBL11]|uniref:Patatin-like phospholipase family protein n=1 Tax=Psychrobacter saeujeotis TaxID=3143436 RepID=A0ABU9XBM5_9GAMM|nr:patatin-like phospholipase family protein [uncultured Psychrobacter sp.]
MRKNLLTHDSSLLQRLSRTLVSPRLRITFSLVIIVLIFVSMTSCTPRVWNTSIIGTDNPSYNFKNNLPSNSDDVFVVLAFSGGGTRAAALSYGVLEKLRDTPVMINDVERRLLDEVDVISSVSGGSYTAAYYGLFGDEIFERFAPEFLYEDWQSRLMRLAIRPQSLIAMSSSEYNRGDLVANNLNESLFRQKSFADMGRGKLPFVILNASDLNNAMTFSFTQQQFDFLCSDLSSYPVASAVMASSSVPGIFAPIALRNFTDCPQRSQPWVTNALNQDDHLPRSYAIARALDRYSQPDRMPVVRLVDGGVTDNLGVRGSMMSPVTQYGDVPNMAGAFSPDKLRQVKQVLVVVANAQTYSEHEWSVQSKDPSFIQTVSAASEVALGTLNNETISSAKKEFLQWGEHVNAQRPAASAQVAVHFAVLTFDQIKDKTERAKFDAMPTTFRLQPEQVDDLRALSSSLLDQSEEFQKFRKALQ